VLSQKALPDKTNIQKSFHSQKNCISNSNIHELNPNLPIQKPLNSILNPAKSPKHETSKEKNVVDINYCCTGIVSSRRKTNEICRKEMKIRHSVEK
jgi:hypothetical protein